MLRHNRRYIIVCVTLGVLLLVGSGLVGSARNPNLPSGNAPLPSLVFRGHRYGVYTPSQDEQTGLRAGAEIGRLTFRWQSGGILPPQTPVRQVINVVTPEAAAVPADQLIAVEIAQRVVFYHPYGAPTLDADEVALGIVASVEQVPCPEYSCFGKGAISQITLTDMRVWQSLQGIEGIALTLLHGDSSPVPVVGSTIVVLFQRTAPIPARGIPRYFWIDSQFIYTVTDNYLTPLDNRVVDEPLLTVDQAQKALAEIFAGVCLTTPPPIASPAIQTPGAPLPTAVPPRKRC